MDSEHQYNPLRDNEKEHENDILVSLVAGFSAGVAATLGAIKLIKNLIVK